MSIRIGNCSGFYGDRPTAMAEMLTGGQLDYLTGDYLAELTMLILGRDQLRDPSLGYARTFVAQLRDSMATALERQVPVIANAGGLNPAGLAQRLTALADELGLAPTIAYIDGDNVAPQAAELGLGQALTANAYLGGFGIAAALQNGADIVVTGRVTDASLVVGAAMAHYDWAPTDYDQLAAAVVAGHVIECGAQASGGNYAGFLELARDATPLGFPIAEIDADGTVVITKHDGTGGAVNVDTVTAQLVYEIQTTHYLNPDVTTDLSSIQLADAGPDRVRISGVRGTPPPAQLKVGVNELGGFRNQMELVLTGLDIEAKAAWVRTQLEAALAANPPASITWDLGPLPPEDADTQAGASTLLRVVVKDADAEVVGKGFTGPAVALALSSYPGFTMTAPPAKPSPFGVFKAYYIDREHVTETVHLPDGSTIVIPGPPQVGPPPESPAAAVPPPQQPASPTQRLPLGTLAYARSGDKGGNANIGVWIPGPRDDVFARRYAWLRSLLTVEQLKMLLPEAAQLPVHIYPLPNLGGLNIVIEHILGEGVAASTRFDPQAKGLAEWLRSRHVDIPQELL